MNKNTKEYEDEMKRLDQGTADEFLHDGDALVTWDDGTYGTVKWNSLRLAP